MNIGVIFAGGTGSRCDFTDCPKQFLEINGKPIIVHTLEHFEECAEVDAVVVVCLNGWIEHMWSLTKRFHLQKVVSVVPGGETGQASIYQGLLAAKQIAGEEDAIVLIHDGVRPLISPELLTENIHAVREYGSAITCAKMTETAVQVETDNVIKAFPRPQVQIAKAPQSFWLKDILAAHEDAKNQEKLDYIDSCSLMMNYVSSLHFVECEAENIKITNFEDIYLLRALLRARENKANMGIRGEQSER